MKCKNCGFQKDAHIEATGELGRRWLCPNGSGESFPATIEIAVALHYRAGDCLPWVARWVHPTAGFGEALSASPAEALEQAGRLIEKSLEEKTEYEKNIEKTIKER